MKYSIVNGNRQEAQPGTSGECLCCSQPTIAKCGEVKIWHWAHSGKRLCDPWWENETEWHRTWKGHFPVDWQENIHQADDGERHIADVKTDQGWVLEFQHSYLKPEERRSRDNFYPKLVWIVDGTRRKRDQKQFFDALNYGGTVCPRPLIKKVSPLECTLLREWGESNAPVFFDFREEHAIWWLLPKAPNGRREYIAAYSRKAFVDLQRSGTNAQIQDFSAFLDEFSKLVADRERNLRR